MALPLTIRRTLDGYKVPALLGMWDEQRATLVTAAPNSPAYDAAQLLMALIGFELALRGSDCRRCADCDGPHGRHLPTCGKVAR